MNAINFIKHYGLNTAIRITEDSKNDDFWDTETAFYTDKNSESCVCISELKRLVESVYLVKEHNTLDRAIEYANSQYTAPEIKVCLLDAIADYKVIYSENDMGDDSHIENHISPLCKKYDERVNSNETK